MAICDGENCGGRLASLDEGIYNHAGVGGSCGVLGKLGNGAIENIFLQVFLHEYPRCCER